MHAQLVTRYLGLRESEEFLSVSENKCNHLIWKVWVLKRIDAFINKAVLYIAVEKWEKYEFSCDTKMSKSLKKVNKKSDWAL